MKIRFIKALALVLSAIMLLSSLLACNDKPASNGTSNSTQGTEEITDTDNGSSNNDSQNNSDSQDNNGSQDGDSSQGGTEEAPDADAVTVFANGKYSARLIRRQSPRSFDKDLTEQICGMFKTKVGSAPEVKGDYTVAGASRYNGPAILVGKTTYPESEEVYKTLGENEAKAVLVGNKYVIAYSNDKAGLTLFKKIFEVFTENASKSSIVINSKWNITVTVDDSPAIPQMVRSLVVGVDQRNQRVVLYDLDAYTGTNSLDAKELWEISVGHATDAKYREGSVFGNVIAVSGTTAGIYEYPSKKKVWTTTETAKNPHSAELLPSGNFVIASSTDGKLRLFKTAALLNNDTATAKKYTDYSLPGAHGVLWDPTYKVLWAIGDYELRAYKIQGSGKNETLVEDTSMRISLPTGKQHGHDLSPDYTDNRYLYITTNACVMMVDKEKHQLIIDFPNYTLLTSTAVKGFSNNVSGTIFFTGEAGGAGTVWDNEWYESWCTDSIYYVYRNPSGKALQKVKLTSAKSAFYKTRVFCGRYQ